MEFSDKDRKLIVKIARDLKKYQLDTDSRLRKLEVGEKKDEKVLSPLFKDVGKGPLPGSNFSRDIPYGDESLEGESSIQVTFREGMQDPLKHQIIIESVYQALRELCDANGIEKLLIRIEDT